MIVLIPWFFSRIRRLPLSTPVVRVYALCVTLVAVIRCCLVSRGHSKLGGLVLKYWIPVMYLLFWRTWYIQVLRTPGHQIWQGIEGPSISLKITVQVEVSDTLAGAMRVTYYRHNKHTTADTPRRNMWVSKIIFHGLDWLSQGELFFDYPAVSVGMTLWTFKWSYCYFRTTLWMTELPTYFAVSQ